MNVKWITIGIAFMLLAIPNNTMTYSFEKAENENVNESHNNGNVLYVGGSGAGNYTSIQDAINDAGNGYTIYVYPKQYNESVVINKSISLIGENRDAIIIDGMMRNYPIHIFSSNVSIEQFTIQHGKIGIYAEKST